jgi:predicted TIM-barrel fold metal-dependent hydrolase
MKIIDTHQHLWDMDLFSFSWCKDIPPLDRSFRMPDYIEAIRGVGIEKSVHLEADVDEPYMLDETRYILALAGANDNPLEGVVACGRPEKDGFRKYLDSIAGHPALKGMRRVLHTQPDDVGRSETFIENIKVLPTYGLSFDLCVLARQLPIVIALVNRCPQVTFILDHCGVPQVKERVLDPWRRHIQEISRFPNVSCKVSGLVAYADP